MLKEAVNSWLMTQGALRGLVGKRILPGVAPKNTPFPYLTFVRVGTTTPTVLVGTVRIAFSRVQFDCWGSTALEAEQVGDLLRAGLLTWLDDPTQPAWGDVTMQSLTIEDDADDEEPAGDSSDDASYRRRIDVTLCYEEQTLPTLLRLDPTSIANIPGSTFTITLYGIGFTPNSVVYTQHTPLPTTFIDAHTLQARLSFIEAAACISSFGSCLLHVANSPSTPSSGTMAVTIS